MKNKRLIFVLLSSLFVFFMFGFYGSRLVYFYRTDHKRSKSSGVDTIISHIIKNEKKLLNDNNNYYYQKNTKSNYVYYSGLMYRILYLKENSIVLINDENVTNLKYGSNDDINNWLEDVYLNNLNQIYLKNKKIKLLDKNLFAKIGGKDSYIKGDDFWAKDGLIISDKGIEKTDNYNLFLGVRPIIELNNFKYVSGEGTKKDPYLVEKRIVNTLDDLYVGDYIKYNNETMRVIEKNDKCIKVLANKLNEKFLFSYHTNKYGTNYKSDLGSDLNTWYLDKFNKNDIIETDYYIGEYNNSYKDTLSEKVTIRIGLLKIGDYFISSIPNSFTLTKKDELVYSINKDGLLHQSKIDEELDVYPVIPLNKNLKISTGNGYKNNPYVVGDEGGKKEN